MKQRYLLATAVALAVVSLTACGGDDKKSGGTLTITQFCQKDVAACSGDTQTECEGNLTVAQQLCPTEFNAAIKCAGSNPQFTCGTGATNTAVVHCETEGETAFACVVGKLLGDAGLGGMGGMSAGGSTSQGGSTAGGGAGGG